MANQILNDIKVIGDRGSLNYFMSYIMEAVENEKLFDLFVPEPEKIKDVPIWKGANWGTRREATEVAIFQSSECVSINFITSDSHCGGVIEAMAMEFQFLRFDVVYSDQGTINNSGSYEILKATGTDTRYLNLTIETDSNVRWKILERTWREDIFFPEDEDEYIYIVDKTLIRAHWDDDGYFQLYVHTTEDDPEKEFAVWIENGGCCLKTNPTVDFREAFNEALDLLEIDKDVIEKFKSRKVQEFDRDRYWDIV